MQVRGWVARGCNRFKQSFDAGDSNGRFNRSFQWLQGALGLDALGGLQGGVSAGGKGRIVARGSAFVVFLSLSCVAVSLCCCVPCDAEG